MTGLALRLAGIGMRFGPVEALAPLDLDAREGEFVVLVGPSGCGKTTLLRIVAGLEVPTTGRVFIGSEDVTERDPADRDVAMVFQNFALYPHMTVRENLGFGLRMRGTPRADVGRAVAHAAATLELDGLLDRKPGQLSGGQRQRVALGRALVRSPRLFLFDEPLSNLDAQLRTQTRYEIADLHARLGATTVFVTHDQTEAMTLGDRIAVLREGRLQQYGTPLDLYQRPDNLFVARFIGTPRINELRGTVRGGAFMPTDVPPARVPVAAPDGPATLAVRAEGIRLTAPDRADALFPSAVTRLEPLGNETLVHGESPGEVTWIARAAPDRAPAPGSAVGVAIDPVRAHVFDAEGRRCGNGSDVR